MKRFLMFLALSALVLPACGESDDAPAPECGNGILEDGEACDDGNRVDDDECSNRCTKNDAPAPECGNGILEDGEACDDGNRVDDDECSNRCTKNDQNSDNWYTPSPGPKTTCGDGFPEAGEICEVGFAHPKYSDWTCINQNGVCVWQTPSPICGNGILEDGEACDDGNELRGDGCDKKCKIEKEEDVCMMRNGSKGIVLLVQDGDTLKIRLTNDGKCKDQTIVTVRIHGLDCPECIKTTTVSPVDATYNAAKACDEAQTAPCAADNLYGYGSIEECRNHNEKGGYEAARFANGLIYAEENAGEALISCDTVSDTDATCLLDNTRARYLAYVGVRSNNATIDLGKALIDAGLGLSFTAFTSRKAGEYCAAEKDALGKKAGVWANGDTFREAAEASFGSDKLLWLLHGSHCK